MTVQTVTVQMPQTLYQRLERLAKLTRRPLEKLVVQTLEAGAPPLPDDLPEATRGMLMALENLDDAALWQVARSVVDPEQWEQHCSLLEKNQQGALTDAERTHLTYLRQEADALMLRKAYAWVLLKWRGYHLPSLADLEAQA